MCENAVNARVPVAVPGARGSSPLLKKVAGAVAATAALGAATAAYGHFVELNNFQLRTESLPVLPAGSPDFRILHISDMHMIPGQRKKTEFMHSLAALEPDLVMNTGDNLSHVGGMEPLLEALDPLMDFPGVFVPGSNCYFAPIFKNPARYLWQPRTPQTIEEGSRVALPIEQMHEAFESRGWTGLVNRYDTLKLNGLRLEF
ncbi:MAG: metallophosphoesterase, partial [Rothia mucilaginosa]|nr:metallophosphoesterase [Rothia mucilaginosa]